MSYRKLDWIYRNKWRLLMVAMILSLFIAGVSLFISLFINAI